MGLVILIKNKGIDIFLITTNLLGFKQREQANTETPVD